MFTAARAMKRAAAFVPSGSLYEVNRRDKMPLLRMRHKRV
nr:MAG TPA: hypothetical protein [Caudoviricetes sp.]